MGVSENSRSLEDLASEQGIGPDTDIRSQVGTWPGDVNDGFEAEIERLRRQNCACWSPLMPPTVREWHGLDAEKEEFPPALAGRIAGWRRVLVVVRVVAQPEVWYATGIDGDECAGLVWRPGTEPQEYRMPLCFFHRLKPWEIDRLRMPEL